MKKHNLDTKTDPPGTVTHYIEGDGMGVHHRTKITGGDARNLQEMTQFVDSIKKQYGSEESPSRNSVEWSIKRHIIISKKILKAAGLPDEPRKDGKRIDLEGLVLAKGFKKHSSPEWYAARILEDNDIVAANIGHEDAAWMGLHLGYLIREFENK